LILFSVQLRFMKRIVELESGERKMAQVIKGISLIIPAHNEGEVIYKTAAEAVRVLEKLSREYEIIIVDDGSTDETPREIERITGDFANVRAVALTENQGKGNALKRGFQSATRELVVFLDADLDLNPSLIGILLKEMETTGADVVIGSKRHPDSSLSYPWYRKVYSTIYYFLILLMFRLPVKDTQTGIKLFHREVLARTFPRLVCKRYTLDLELLAVAHRIGYSVAEAPISLSFQREFGRIKLADVRNIIVDTLAIFYRLYILRYYDSPLKPVVETEPKISIVIPTRVLDPMTVDCVRKCDELNYTNYDIKLVTDNFAEVRLEHPASIVIRSGPVGPAVKRNMGTNDSDAEIIAFIDSDAWPEQDWLKNAVPYFEDENVAAVCGPAVTPFNDNKRQLVSGLIYSSFLVSGNTTYRYTYHALREVDDYPSCNLLVRRTDFVKVGGFPEEYWPGEDTVLCLKLTKELEKRIIYVPNVIVNHHRRPIYRAHLRQVYSYGLHRGFFVRKFPETSRRLQYFVPSLFVIALSVGLGLSFINPIILYAYMAFVGVYLISVLLSSIKSLNILDDVLVFPGVIATNITYGLGFMRGLFSRRLKSQ
jgi:cellulose synthase/poly-beta-1,6-N-acetylglucosamine synthase-like glycosyltransferase